ncbi:MAG: SMC family ATPase [Leptolyngbyaceae cyanobacterium bins.349]|nr:SMC family ATPase [Leptolyngbyaceae cyanobacterium bins.349]
MEILSVTLKNFKSHSDRHFVFQPGTNAICGENGAGKTSILEAIAWVLFDYAGDYNKEDLIRNGAGNAQARVVFVSNRDGRTYEVQRCTSKSYTLFDPQLNERLPYSRIKEEVMPWLRQHLGVAPGTDLAQLFSSTIGVPQGTFTADFLLTRERRKPIFDKILKVEEYQQTWKKLADLEKYAKTQVETLERDIHRYTEELQQLDDIQAKRDRQQLEITLVKTELEQAQQEVLTLQQQVEHVGTQATRLNHLEQQQTQLAQQIHTQTRTLTQLQEDLQHAEHAANICIANRDAYQAFQQAETQLRELEQHRRTEQTLQQRKRQQEKHLSDRQTELAKLTLQVNRLQEARQEIDRLEPLAQQQRHLEREQQTVSQQLQACHTLRQTVQEQEKRLAQLQTRQSQLGQDIAEIQSLAAVVQEIPNLEHQQHRLQQQLSRVTAAIQFEADLRHLLTQSQTTHTDFLHQVQQATTTLQDLQQAMPLWQDALTKILATLTTGSTSQRALMDGLHHILADLAQQTATTQLEQQLQTVQTRLQTARRNQVKFANLERLLTDHAQLERDRTDLQTHLADLKAQLVEEAVWQERYTELAQALATLENPIARMQLYQHELQQEASLKANVAAMQITAEEIATAIAQLEAQLAPFANLNETLAAQQALRDQHREAYEIYAAHREVANSRKLRTERVHQATAELQQAEQTQQELLAECDRLRQSFDPDQFHTLQTAYQTARDQHTALTARLPEMLRYLADLEQQLTRLDSLHLQQQALQAQLEQKKKTDRFIKFARKTYKEAGPRITERYIQRISHAADRLFRELLNRPNVSLQWTRDYDIVVQEGAHSRRFVNLSGGEQMCAALAVRLALLKVLADIDIAFFDEPTTNMDRPRREHLAEAIANIKTFRQLFVISHDDTFEKITENIIVVEREV